MVRFAQQMKPIPMASQSGHLHSCQVSALFGPRRWPDSSALQPLHSISLQLHKLRFRSIAFRRSQTAETVKNSGAPGRNEGQIGMVPKWQVAWWQVLQAPRRFAARAGEPWLRCGFA